MRNSVLAGTIASIVLGAALFFLYRPAPEPLPQARPARGQLVDFHGVPLTASDVRWRPAVNMEVLQGYTPASIARFVGALAGELGIDPNRLSGFTQPTLRPVLERQVSVQVSESRMSELRVWLAASEWRDTPQLIRYIEVPGRLYPHREVAANLIGFVGFDGDGQEGMELALDRSLDEGHDARLSIDIDLQRQLASTMQKAIEQHQLREANAVVMELGSHRIASVVSLPSFDPAINSQRSGGQVRLKPVTDVFQAGPLLEPFYLGALLDSAPEDTPMLRARFIKGESGVGLRMVTALGYERARAGLESYGLLSRIDADFPGVVGTLERKGGSDSEMLRDLGNGAAIAPSLLRYATSFAALIDGQAPHSVRVLMASAAPPEQLSNPYYATQAQSLRAAMVERARWLSENRRADFGGMWVNFSDRVEQGETTRRAAVVMFAPAAAPKFLVTMMFVTPASIAERDLLEVGREALSSVSLSYQRGGAVQVL